VPPDSSAKKRATQHALINTTALALFTAGWLLGKRSRRTAVPLALQTLGTAAISVGGWMGGTLAYRNQIGVDHRYANAGKWQEETRDHRRTRALTSAAAPLGVDQMKLVHAGDERIVVARTEHGHAAFQDRCTHRGGSLSDGVLICGVVQCPWHGSQFDVRTGNVRCGPAEENIKTYEIDPAHVPVRSA
jgi:nitrite reductase/ring-hydroxylating ferredoxin subunit